MPQTKLQRALWREKNKDKTRQSNKEIRQLRKAFAVQELGNKCAICGHTYPQACYDFHHKNPTEKDTNIAKMLLLSYDRFVQEVKKCILVCANCHRILHHGDLDADNPNYS